jgi:6-phosphogluconolactonase
MQPAYGNLYVYDDSEQLAQQACEAFVDLAKTTIAAQGRFRVALSGGSTPKRLYELLAQQQLPWESIDWFWGDERFVPHSHQESNYRMVRESLLSQVPIPPGNIFPVPFIADSPQQSAFDYETVLRSQFPDSSWPEFDLVLLGLGDDAHTASLFPETDALEQEDRWFIENWVPKFDTYRLTLTAPAINAGANIWFLIAGEGKQTALGQIWGEQRDPVRLPAQLIKPDEGVLWWLVTATALPAGPNQLSSKTAN